MGWATRHTECQWSPPARRRTHGYAARSRPLVCPVLARRTMTWSPPARARDAVARPGAGRRSGCITAGVRASQPREQPKRRGSAPHGIEVPMSPDTITSLTFPSALNPTGQARWTRSLRWSRRSARMCCQPPRLVCECRNARSAPTPICPLSPRGATDGPATRSAPRARCSKRRRR